MANGKNAIANHEFSKDKLIVECLGGIAHTPSLFRCFLLLLLSLSSWLQRLFELSTVMFSVLLARSIQFVFFVHERCSKSVENFTLSSLNVAGRMC